MPVSDPLALYVHWPFCVSKCPYCDFNSHVRADPEEAGWRAALLAELALEHALTPSRRLGSIFFGGGTPSLMQPETVAAVIDEATRLWGADADVEITLEANPTSVEAAKLRAFREAGVNRLSLGVQSLEEESLRRPQRQTTSFESTLAFARLLIELKTSSSSVSFRISAVVYRPLKRLYIVVVV